MFSPENLSSESLLPAPALPTLEESDLRHLYREGWHMVGVLGLILDQQDNLLFLEHAASSKNLEGMWGAMGETPLMQQLDSGQWLIETPLHTLMRGMEEELGVAVDSHDLTMPRENAYFTHGWPLGIASSELSAFGICPVVKISPRLKENILQASATREILSKQFLSIDQAYDLSFVRPGIKEWLHAAEEALISHKNSSYYPVGLTEQKINPRAASRDAILKNIFG